MQGVGGGWKKHRVWPSCVSLRRTRGPISSFISSFGALKYGVLRRSLFVISYPTYNYYFTDSQWAKGICVLEGQNLQRSMLLESGEYGF